MPLYEYQCERCEYKFSLFRHIDSRDRESICPLCGGPGHRTLTAPMIQVKKTTAATFPDVDERLAAAGGYDLED